MTIGTNSSAPDADFASAPLASGRVARGRDDGGDAEGGGAAQDRADIVRIGDLVEHQHDAVWLELPRCPARQRVGLGQQAVMHRVGGEPPRDIVRPNDLMLRGQGDAALDQTARGVFRGQQPAHAARGIFQRSFDAVPAIENDKTVAVIAETAACPRAAAAAGAADAAFRCPWGTAIPDAAITHRRLMARGANAGNFRAGTR